jgi:diacylglycerol kinase (ATP)
MTAALLLANTGAGSADARRLEACERILRSRWSVEVRVLDEVNDLDEALDERDGRRLVIAGGDGTLHHTVAALYRRGELRDTVLGLVPLGTGNDFARHAAIPFDVQEAARLVMEGREHAVDIIVDDLGEVAVNNVHLGVSAEVSRRGAVWKERLGRIGYGVGLLAASFARSGRWELEIDGELVVDRSRRVLDVSVGNGSMVGGGLALHPAAEPTDGKLDVIISFAAGPLRRVGYGMDLFRGRHLERPDVMRRSCGVLAASGEPFYTCADGEIDGPVERRVWRIEPGLLRMILPDGTG